MAALRKRLSDFWRLWRGRLIALLDLAALACALAGSWLYYSPKIASGAQLVSSTAFSAVKLFLFSPGAGLADPVPLAYAIAMWLCPLCTAVAVFRLLESTLRHALGGLSRFFRPYILVCGQGSDCLTLVDSLRHGGGFFRRKVILVTQSPLPVELRLPLERGGVTVFAMPLENATAAERTVCLRRLHLDRADGAVLFHPEVSLNFSILKSLEQHLEKYPRRCGALPCALYSGDGSMQPLISRYRQEHQGAGGSPLDLKCFSTAALAARDLFLRRGLGADSLAQLDGSAQPHKQTGSLKPSRLLIAGLGACGEAVLLHAAALSPTAPGALLDVTVLDQDAEQKLHRIKAKYPQLHRFVTLQAVQMDVLSDELPRALHGGGFTYAAVCFRDPSLALRTAEALEGDFPIGVRLDGSDALARCLDESGGPFQRAFPFGERRSLLTQELVLGTRLDEAAMAFHAGYCAQEQRLFHPETPPIPWDALDSLKKDSTRAQAAYCQSYLIPLRDKLLSRCELEICRNALSDCKDNAGMLRTLLSAHPAIALLARLEHERWCGFLYAHGYQGRDGNTRNDLFHPCLVDWEALLRDDETCKTVCYDLIPILLMDP